MTKKEYKGAIPSQAQLAWHKLESYGFVHFTINTFTDREWGYGDESPEMFNPDQLDCDQWVEAAKLAGLKGLILTAKHHDGFCLWPTKTTEHNITKSPFRDGEGDLVRELSEACARGGIKFGIYCSPWDRNHPEYARAAYVEVYHEQWRELLTNYGPLFEIWLDGANGGDGYYGGARETRSIDAQTYYRNDELLELFRELQPDAVVAGGPGADLRWCGNEHGFTGFTNWATVNVGETLNQAARDMASIEGVAEGHIWRPTEVDVSIRRGWFWHEMEKPHDPDILFQVWLNSVGRGAGLLINLAPNQRGLIPVEDVKHMMQFGHLQKEFMAVDLVKGRTVHTEDTLEGKPGHLVDGNPETYWKAKGQQAEFIISLSDEDRYEVPPISGLRLEEDIRQGQRVSSWALDVRVWGAWVEATRGTTIGATRMVQLNGFSGDSVRLRILDAVVAPVLRRISVFAGVNRLH